MGLVMATTLVLVNMVGTVLFLLPVSMASVGRISIWGWLVASVGAAAIGLMFAQLGAVDPKAGGPYAYARDSLGLASPSPPSSTSLTCTVLMGLIPAAELAQSPLPSRSTPKKPSAPPRSSAGRSPSPNPPSPPPTTAFSRPSSAAPMPVGAPSATT